MAGNNNRPVDLLAAIETVKLAQSPELGGILGKLDYQERIDLMNILKTTFIAGQDSSDQRTGKLMARIFGGFVGVTPGIDNEEFHNLPPGQRIKNMVRMLAGITKGRDGT